MASADGQPPPSRGETMNRRYLALLAGASLMVLLVGGVLRDRLARSRPPASAPPSEASALQQLSQAGELRRRTDFVNERVAEVARWVEWLPESHSSGVKWPALDGIATSTPSRPVEVLPATARSGGDAAPVVAAETPVSGWVVLVARTVHAGLVSVPATLGGTHTIDCAGEPATAYILNVPLSPPFVGAAIFDLDRRIVGLVVRCGASLAALPAAYVTRLGSAASTPRARLLATTGLSLHSSGDSVARAIGDSGVVVHEVRVGSAAHRGGLLPGDVILSIDRRPVSDAEGVARAFADTSVVHRVTRRRGSRTVETTLGGASEGERATDASPEGAGVGIDVSAPRRGVTISNVARGSAAERAGLRPGDVLVRVGDDDVTDARSVQRALRRADRAPTFIVFERDSVLRGAMVPR